MWPYWILYLIPALLTLFVLDGRSLQLTPSFWMVLGLFFAFFIGFRYEVGGDWGAYLGHYDYAVGKPLIKILAEGRDPGYAFVNWLMARWGLGIYAVNLLCGAIFITGLIIFCRQQQDSLLAFAIAIPYLIIVVAMGYTRQGVALGLLFWAISYLDKGKFFHYLALIAAAALFHKTVLIMVPFGVLLSGKGGLFRVGGILLAGYGLWDALFAQDQERLQTFYLDQAMISQGAKIRVMMNVLPALLLLLYWKRWKQSFPNPQFWFWMAVASLITYGLVDYASTAVDRIALYLAPIQLTVYSRLAHLPLLPGRQLDPDMVTVAILSGYAAALFVWLNFATHAVYWVPYQNIVFQ
jgi:hypothetical protein